MKLNLFDFLKSILFSIKGCVSYFLNDTSIEIFSSEKKDLEKSDFKFSFF